MRAILLEFKHELTLLKIILTLIAAYQTTLYGKENRSRNKSYHLRSGGCQMVATSRVELRAIEDELKKLLINPLFLKN